LEKSTRKLILIATYIVVLYWALTNIKLVSSGISNIMGILSPIIIGIFIAFILNILLKIIEKGFRVFTNVKWLYEKRRLFSIILTYLITITFITAIIFFIVPQVIESAETLVNTIPQYSESLKKSSNDLFLKLGLSNEDLNELLGNWKELLQSIGEFTANTIDKIFNFTLNFASGVVNFFIGIIFSIYILLYKEKLIHILRKLINTYTSDKVSSRISHIAKEINHTFTRFIGGQLTEAIILGTMCFIGMAILRLPYVPLISVLIGITSLIPLLGAYIGTIPAAFIIFMENPMQALIFILFILIIQQIEGNFIYPKVVGKAIGLDGFWVFLAIIIGGSMFGILGMMLGVPSMAVIYTIIREATNKRLKKTYKGIN